MQLTLKLRVTSDSETEKILKETLKAYTGSFNRVSAKGWQEERINGVELHKKTYGREREESRLPSQLVCSARVKAVEALKSARALIKKGKKAKQPGSERCPIRYDARSSTINLKEGKATLSTLAKRKAIKFTIPEYHKDKIGWDVCSADLCQDKQGRLFLHVVVEKKDKEFKSSGKVVGVDLGITRPAVTSDNKFLGESHWKEVDKRNYKLKRELQAKGTKSAKRHLRKLRGKEKRFRTNCDHVLSKQIVLAAQEGTVLVLEDLKHIRSRIKGTKAHNRRMHSWSFDRLSNFMAYKGKMQGILVVYSNPRYTSRECSRCGYIDKKNRKTQTSFSCKSCFLEMNADLNAAKNIKRRYQVSGAISAARWAPVNEPIVTENLSLVASHGL